MKRNKLLIIGLTLIFMAVASVVISAEEKAPKIKTWKMPDFLHENLLNFKRNFEIQFQAKLDQYLNIMRERFDEFKDLPDTKQLVFDLETGQILTREDYQRLISQAKAKQIQQQSAPAVKKEQENEKDTK